MPQINPKCFYSLSLLYFSFLSSMYSLTLPICYCHPPLLVCLLSLPTSPFVSVFVSLSWSSLHWVLYPHFSFFPHILPLTHPHSHSLCDSFYLFLLVPSSPLTPSYPHLSVFSLHLSSFSLPSLPVALGRNQPLKRERPKWKSDYPMTEGQLRSKRDEFWDTAPAFEGRKEIWDALRAAASAFESNDHLLAQAILDGASITLPHGNTHLHRDRCSKYITVLVLLSIKYRWVDFI